MGTCLSKKKVTSTSSAAPSSYATGGHINGVSGSSAQAKVADSNKPKAEKQEQEEEKPVEEEATQVVKKEIFVIKHRKSHDDRERNSKNSLISQQKESSSSSLSSSSSAAIETANAQIVEKASSTPMAAGVRTSSCTKEEVDAILIQCGRLSRSSSGNAASSSASCERGRKYSGSKRSFDFDNCDNNEAIVAAATDEEKPRHRNRSRTRQSTRASPSPQGRRRTPSRERDNQRSSSRERRVSRSPGKQRGPENGGTTATASANVSGSSSNCNRPGKMVSVPATVSSLVMDKSNNGGSSCGEIKRISVKRNVGGGGGEVAARSAASPRYQSPTRANGKASNEVQQPQPQPVPSLSRNSSRKAEQSPYRRNPLSEIDPNTLAYPQANSNKIQNKNKREIEVDEIVVMEQSHVSNQKPNSKSSRVTKEQAMVETNIVTSDGLKPPQTLTRTRSSRRSRDFDINPEATLSNPTPSYTRLLLEDIQNFHQKSTNPVAVSLPPCVSKACSILEAVADLNSTTTSILSEQSNVVGKNMKEPFVESEVMMGSDDLTEPSFHKYVTVRRGGTEMEDQESSGSNSFVGGGSQNPNWGFSSSSWEPNSAESTDCWTGGWRSGVGGEEAAGGRSNTPVRFDTEGGVEGEGGKKMSGTKRESGQRSGGIGRGRLGVKGLHTISMAAST